MFVNKLVIKEFRGIKSCKNPIKLSNFTVLIGRNNSGKSTILEALSLLPSPKTIELISKTNKIDFLRDLHNSSPDIKNYKSLIYLYTGTSIIEYGNIDNKFYKILIFEKKVDYDSLPTNIMIERNKKNQVYQKNSSDIAVFFHIALEQIENSVLFIPNNTSYFKKMEREMDVLKDFIIKKGIHNKVTKSLNKCVDDEYSEVMFEPLRLRKILPDTTPYIKINDLGSGAEKFIKIMILIEAINPKLVLIDDFEAGLHPSMINIFLKWLKDRECQTIISTHSIDVLYKLTDIEPTDTTILQLKKSHEDILNYKVLTLEKLEDFLNANTDPRLLVDALDL